MEGTSTMDLPRSIALRTGARYLGDRWIAEVGGDLWLLPASAAAPTWQVGGIGVFDQSGASTRFGAVPSRASTGTHGALRAAIDVELLAGFLWATGRHAFTTAAPHT